MKCAYCGNETKGTKEHIISCSVLDLFPECFLTYDFQRNIMHEADPVIKDVCANCNNNKISYIDSYAKNFIETYFIRKYSENNTVEIEYDYTLIQKMLLKYAYNDMRSRKEDCSFFNDEILSFLTDSTNNTPKENVTVLCGLAVNTSPLPDFATGNLKIRLAKNPVLYANDSIEYINITTGEFSINKNVKKQEFSDLAFSYVFRFNSVQFLLFCWEKNSEKIKQNNIVLKYTYPYAILNETNTKTILPICTNEINYHHFEYIHIDTDGIKTLEYMRKLANSKQYEFKEKLNTEWEKAEENIAKKHPRN